LGWRPVFPTTYPRLFGKDRLAYVIQKDNSIGLDPAYVPTLEEWMNIRDLTDWGLYANGVFLNVALSRGYSLLDPNKPGTYMMTFKLETDVNYFRGFFRSDVRPYWKEVLPARLAEHAVERAKKEAELKAQGVAIDESYQDPMPPK
jgi:hypothetical protein